MAMSKQEAAEFGRVRSEVDQLKALVAILVDEVRALKEKRGPGRPPKDVGQ